MLCIRLKPSCHGCMSELLDYLSIFSRSCWSVRIYSSRSCWYFRLSAGIADLVEERFNLRGISPEGSIRSPEIWQMPQVLRLSKATTSSFETASDPLSGTAEMTLGSDPVGGTVEETMPPYSGNANKKPSDFQSLRYLPANPNPRNSNSAVFFLCQVRSCCKCYLKQVWNYSSQNQRQSVQKYFHIHR